MVTYIRNFRSLWDAWEFCGKHRKDNPVLIEKKRKGNVKEIKVIIKLKNRK